MTVAINRDQLAPARVRRAAVWAPRLAAVAILIAFFAVGLYYNVANPIWEAPDEPAHYQHVVHIAQTGTLPIRQAKAGDQLHQPPLYYVLGSLAVGWLELEDQAPAKPNPRFIWLEPRQGTDPNIAIHLGDELPPYQGTVLAVHLLRLLSLLGCAIAVGCTYALARLVVPERPWLAVAATGFTAFVPQFLFVASTVSNDGIAIGLGSLTLLLVTRLALRLQEGAALGYRDFAVLGLVVGLGMLSKLTYYGLLPLLIVVFLYSLAVAAGRRQRLFAGWVLAGVIGVALSGWWYARNLLVYATGLALFGPGRIDPRTTRDIPEKPEEVITALGWYPEPLFQSFWLRFGWMDIHPDPWVYDAAIALSVGVVAGLFMLLARGVLGRRPLGKSARLGIGLCLLAFVCVFAITTWRFAYTLGNHYPQGRYLYPVQAGTALLAVFGLAEIAGLPLLLAGQGRGAVLAERARCLLGPPLAVAFATLLALAAWGALDAYIKPAYAYVPIWRHVERAHVPTTVNAEFAGRLALMGFELSQTQVASGGQIDLSLYWQARTVMPNDLQAFVHLAEASGKPVAQKDAPIGSGVATTSQWEPGDLVRETRVIAVDANVKSGDYQLLVGVYSLNDMKRLTLPGGADTMTLGLITVAAAD
ncbi:MAG: DUF2142 domain-containing protein [Chloroflexota bacterium]